MELRAWQAEALARIGRWDGRPAVVRACMGAGKSVVIQRVCEMYSDRRVVVAAPTIDLVDQLRPQLDDAPAYYTKSKGHGPLTVVCFDSMVALAEHLPHTDLLIVDECHLTENPQFKAGYHAINPARLLGFSATPWLGDEKKSLTLFDSLLIDYSPADAMRDGVVVPPVIHRTPEDAADLDLDAVCLAMALEAVQYGPGMASAYDCDDADAFTAKLNAAGVRAAAIHYKNSKTHAESREAHKAGRLDCVVHINKLREGVDLPYLRWGLLRRPRSRNGFPQEVGRLLRAYPGKTEAHIYDPLDLWGLLGLDYEACLGGEAPDESAKPDVPPEIKALGKAYRKLTGERVGYSLEWECVLVQDRRRPEALELAAALRPFGWSVGVSSGRKLDLDPAVRTSTALKLIRDLAIAWRLSGGIDKIQGRAWRTHEPTERQIGGLNRMAWLAKKVQGSAQDKATLDLIITEAAQGYYDRGTTSDVYSVIRAAEAHGWQLWP